LLMGAKIIGLAAEATVYLTDSGNRVNSRLSGSVQIKSTRYILAERPQTSFLRTKHTKALVERSH
jgi:hypothetical protein